MKHPLDIRPSSRFAALPQPPKESDREGHFYPHLTSESSQRRSQGPGSRVWRGPQESCLSALASSSHFTPEMRRPALPSLTPAPAAARVTEARLTLWLTTRAPGTHRADTDHKQAAGAGLRPEGPHVARWGGERQLLFLPSASVPTLGLWSHPKPTASP